MPSLRVGGNLAFGKTAHFLTDRSKCLIKIAAADRGIAALCHQCNESRATLLSPAHERHKRTLDLLGHHRSREAKVTRAQQLALTHGNAADDLGEILLDADRNRQLIDLAQVARGIARN